MAAYRPIHISYWQDKFILKLTPEQKYFYLYLMTNSKTKQSGVYELTKNIISFETGYNIETIDRLLKHFTDSKKILYSESTEEIIILNWVKYNPINNKNIMACVISDLLAVKNTEFIRTFLKIVKEKNFGKGHETTKAGKVEKDYTIELFNRLSEPTYKGLLRGFKAPTKQQTESQSQSQTQSQIDTSEILSSWNSFATKNNLSILKSISASRKSKIKTRMSEGFNLSEIMVAISEQGFLIGDNNKNWKVSFDWLIENDSNFLKVVERKYINNGSATNEIKFINT